MVSVRLSNLFIVIAMDCTKFVFFLNYSDSDMNLTLIFHIQFFDYPRNTFNYIMIIGYGFQHAPLCIYLLDNVMLYYVLKRDNRTTTIHRIDNILLNPLISVGVNRT